MPNKKMSHSMSTNNISSSNHVVINKDADGLVKSASKKSVSNGLLDNSNGKLRLPSLKKLRSKLTLKKSHSTASNLTDLSKLKISTQQNQQQQQQPSTSTCNANGTTVTTTTAVNTATTLTTAASFNEINTDVKNKYKNVTRYNSTFFDNTFSAIQEEPSVVSQQQQQQQHINGMNVKMRIKTKLSNKTAAIDKRISLPANMNIDVTKLYNSQNDVSKFILKPLNRNSRRESMSELGYGKIESYKRLEKLGEGTYATVFKAESTINGSFVALKEIRLEYEEGAPCTAIREASLLRQLKHANIVTLHDIIYTEKSLILVFEYLEKDLKQYMDDCNNLMSMKNVKIFLFQLLRGLAYCHSNHILHRDLKPQNLLINQKGELKLADFGLARAKSIPTKTYSNEVVTLWYRPPDVLLGSTDYSTHIDMWGVGCIFYEMVCGKPFFPGTKVEDELYLIFKVLGTPDEDTLPGVTANAEFITLNSTIRQYSRMDMATLVPRLDADGIDLLSAFLKYNPKLRVSAHDAIVHKYFSTFPSSVYSLDNNQSIFDITTINLAKDLGSKLNSTSGRKFSFLYG